MTQLWPLKLHWRRMDQSHSNTHLLFMHHTPPPAKEVACLWSNCNRRFSMPSDLYLHILDHLKPESNEFNCNWLDCQFKCTKYHQIKSHIHCHVLYQPFKCSVCGKMCKRKFDLKKHFFGVHFKNIDSTLIDDPFIER